VGCKEYITWLQFDPMCSSSFSFGFNFFQGKVITSKAKAMLKRRFKNIDSAKNNQRRGTQSVLIINLLLPHVSKLTFSSQKNICGLLGLVFFCTCNRTVLP
jgi:hypothetical protein